MVLARLLPSIMVIVAIIPGPVIYAESRLVDWGKGGSLEIELNSLTREPLTQLTEFGFHHGFYDV